MAGPSASVIVKTPLSDAQIAEIECYIRSRTNSIEERDFWIDGRPFFWMTGEDYPGLFSEMEECSTRHEVIGWTPADQVLLDAMCGSQEDHLILAELCIEIGHLVSGLIDFGGILSLLSEPTAGDVWEYEYKSVSGESVAHVGTPEFLRWWLQQPNFRMIK